MSKKPSVRKAGVPNARKPTVPENMPSQRTDQEESLASGGATAVEVYDHRVADSPYAYLDPVVLEQWRRYRARRSRRHATVMTTLALFMVSIAVMAYGNLSGIWTFGFLNQEIKGMEDQCARVGMVVPAENVQVRVFNGASVAGLAAGMRDELESRSFDVRSVGDSQPLEAPPADIVISHGARGKLAADTLAAHIDGAHVVAGNTQGAAVTLTIYDADAQLLPASVGEANVAAMVQSGQTLRKLCESGR